MSLVSTVRNWMQKQGLTDAVVGFSGGVDSATTAALAAAAGLRVHLVIAEAPHQKYASPFGGFAGATKFAKSRGSSVSVHQVQYQFMFLDDAANEAAAPIQRLASFYGVCAQLRQRSARPLVVGTTNFDEAAYLGFWGKASDGAQDLYPISHLHKSDVCSLAEKLGVPLEIIEAVPSGDLLFRETNDERMIGATYEQIEEIARASESGGPVSDLIAKVKDPISFCKQITSNSFKYDLPFAGFHLSNRLENFRRDKYNALLKNAHRHLREI